MQAAAGSRCLYLRHSERNALSWTSQRSRSKARGWSLIVFDLIFHPVSNCYVREVKPIWRECYRVLKQGGYLIAGVDHYINYIVDEEEREIVNSLPFDPLTNEEQRKQLEREDAGMQFSHSLEEQITGQLEAGFTLLDLYEDTNGEGRLHELNIPTFLAMRSVKMG